MCVCLYRPEIVATCLLIQQILSIYIYIYIYMLNQNYAMYYNTTSIH